MDKEPENQPEGQGENRAENPPQGRETESPPEQQDDEASARKALKQKREDSGVELAPNMDTEGGRKKVPTILQMEATECGAAALAMVLAHYGCWVPLEKMRSDCGVSRDGSKALNIIRAAREYGMTGRGYRCQVEKLLELPFPMILFWEFNHFVVLSGIKNDKYYLNDPASGPRTVTAGEFNKSFTGVALAMSPGADFQKRKSERPSLLKELLAYMKGNIRSMVFVFLVSLLLVVPGIISPVYSKIFIDDVLLAQNTAWMRLLIIGMVVTTIFTAMLTWMQQKTLNRFQLKLSITLSSRFFWHLLRLPTDFYAQRYIGDINARVGACNQMAALVSGQLATNAVQLVMVIFYAAVMFFYDVWMTLAVIAMNMLNMVMLVLLTKVRDDTLQRTEKEGRKLAGVSISGISIIETLKSNGLEGEFFSKWAGYHGNMLVAQQRFSIWTNVLNMFPTLTGGLTTIFILGLGSWRITEGDLTVGSVIAFNMLSGGFSGPFNGLLAASQSLQAARVAITQINDVMRYDRDKRYEQESWGDLDYTGKFHKAGQMSGQLSGHIEVRNLTFGYSKKEDPLIENLDLVIRPGNRIALVGGSGSGKSTLAKLIISLLKPWSGEVLYDGVPVDSFDPAVLAKSIAFVDQEIVLFEGSLRDNLALWDYSMKEYNITEALRDADIFDEVAKRSNHYDMPVDENGRNFSGGQRQRLEIARALATNPSIIVFDEATAALDPVTEQRIDEHIRRRGCTCIIVAHRLSTVRDADEIIVLEGGNIIERGIHDDLIAREGSRYHQLVSSV